MIPHPVLALDTALDVCAAAIVSASGSVMASEPMARGQGERIAPMIQELMAEAGLDFSALENICVTTGPGTFTGIRIGLAMARGLGLSLGKPVTGLSVLEAIAASAHPATGPILVVMEARAPEFYGAVYDQGLHSLLAPGLMTPEGLARLLPDLVPDETLRVAGTAAGRLVAHLGRGTNIGIMRPDPVRMAHYASALPRQLQMPGPLYLQGLTARVSSVVQVRLAGVSDAGLLAALHARAFDRPWDDAAFATLLASPGVQGWLALDGDLPQALLLVRAAADELEILTLAVVPDRRRHGLARRLLREALSQAPGRTFLEVAHDNVAARNLYEKTGFGVIGRRPGYYARSGGPAVDALLMALKARP